MDVLTFTETALTKFDIADLFLIFIFIGILVIKKLGYILNMLYVPQD